MQFLQMIPLLSTPTKMMSSYDHNTFKLFHLPLAYFVSLAFSHYIPFLHMRIELITKLEILYPTFLDFEFGI